jgi:hypothetical protein
MRPTCLALLVPALCLAQPPAPARDQPHIVFEATHHDFGRIGPDTKVSHRFKVTNTGKAYLNITHLNPSCGCTSTVVGKWSLAPNESTEIEVTFNPAGFRGLNRKSLQVVSDDPGYPTQTLTFEATVVRDITPSTESIFFQDLVRSAPRKASVRLESGNGKPVQIKQAKAEGAPWLGIGSRQDGLNAWVDLTLDGSKVPAGKLVGADLVTVRAGNPKESVITLTVQWEMRASVTATPARVAWADAAGKEQRTQVVLKQVENRPFRIVSWKSTNPVLRLETAGKTAAAQHELQVILSAKAKAGMYNEKLLLTLDDPDQSELEIRVSASLR